MKLPCENAIWYTLPRIRADLAQELVRQGISQKDVADKLGITPSAVSQYRHKKRGGKQKMPKDYDKMISEAAEEIKAGGEDTLQKVLCRCCTCAREKTG